MTSLRHKDAIARIRLDAVKLTKRERVAAGLPPRPVRRAIEPPPFPSDPGAYVWFALTTRPQREALAATALARMGFAAFNPTEVVMARQCRKLKHRRRERERAILTSMVLAGFPARVVGHRVVGGRRRAILRADVPWLDVLEIGDVLGFVGFGGAPRPVPLRNIIELHGATGRRASTRNWSPELGDVVEVEHGAFRGKPGKIVELVDGRAKVALFGEGLFAGHVEPLDVPETWLMLSKTG